MLKVLALALVFTAAAPAPLEDPRAPRRAPGSAVTAAGVDPPAATLRPAAAAMGGSWSDEDVRHYARHFDLVVVGGSARRDRVARFRELNPDIVVLAYTCAFDTYVDNALGQWIRARHPDWFLRDGTGKPLTTYRKDERWGLDPGHEGVRAFFADSARRRMREIGADGVWEDNAFPSYDYRNVANGRTLAAYRSPEEWRGAVDGWLARLEATVGRERLAVNQVKPWTRHGRWVVIEEFPQGGRAWVEMHRGFERVSAEPGRETMLLQAVDAPDDPERAFAAASYLMGAKPGAWLGYYFPGGRLAAQATPEHRLALGRPLGAAREQGGVWFRDFEHARVLVNPTDEPRTAPWPGREGPALAAHGAGIAWRGSAGRVELPQWTVVFAR